MQTIQKDKTMQKVTYEDWWIAMDTDGSLRLHDTKPKWKSHDDILEWWEEEGRAITLTESWREAYDKLGETLILALCDNPRKCKITIEIEDKP